MIHPLASHASFAGFLIQLAVVAADKTALCCSKLSLALGKNKVAYPRDDAYQLSSTTYYAQQEGELAPYCYILPSNSLDVSVAVKTLGVLNILEEICPFAVRSGGHHTVAGIANIHAGVTIDLGNLNTTIVSKDKSLIEVGAGARWNAVYATLVPMGLAALGGRVGDIGVGGFLSGGGISYFGGQYGFGCDMVQNFELVLAGGQIVNANVRENQDLFQALKGGSNNFGIITRFDLKTFKLGQYFGGFNYYYGNQSVQLLEAFASFASNPNFDDKAAIITSAVYSSTQGFVTTCIFTYTEEVMNPPVFDNLTSAATPIVSNLRISNLSDFSGTLGVNQPNNLRETSITATVKAKESLLGQIYLLWSATIPALQSAENLIYAMTFQPLPVNMLKAGARNGGNSLGIDSSEPLIVIGLTAQYTSIGSDGIMESTTRELFKSIEDLARKADAFNFWTYLNYADVSQKVITSYGPKNVERLKAVSKRVDPFGFFQKVQPGGFKLSGS